MRCGRRREGRWTGYEGIRTLHVPCRRDLVIDRHARFFTSDRLIRDICLRACNMHALLPSHPAQTAQLPSSQVLSGLLQRE